MKLKIKLKNYRYCDECPFQQNTEEEQNLIKKNFPCKRIFHYCEWYKKQLYHGDKHPRLPRPQKCIKENGK